MGQKTYFAGIEHARSLDPPPRPPPRSPGSPGSDCVSSFSPRRFDATRILLGEWQQRQALAYAHRRLKPGGWFLVDLKIGPRTTDPRRGRGNVGETALEDFRALYEPLFTARPVRLFNSGFLLRKTVRGLAV